MNGNLTRIIGQSYERRVRERERELGSLTVRYQSGKNSYLE